MIKRRILLFFIAAFIVTSCKSVRRASDAGEATAKKSNVVKLHEAAALKFKTLQAKVDLDFKDDKRAQSVTVELRMEKGKNIWLSARFLGLTAGKLHITRDRVRFYEILNKQSFDGDFSLISDFLGEDVTFDQVEDILLGQAVEPLQDKEFSINGNEYVFNEGTLIAKLFKLRAADFKVSEQAISKPAEDSFLRIMYPDYQMVSDKIVPLKVQIEARKDEKNTTVILEYRSLEFNKNLSFPFEMPANTKPIKL